MFIWVARAGRAMFFFYSICCRSEAIIHLSMALLLLYFFFRSPSPPVRCCHLFGGDKEKLARIFSLRLMKVCDKNMFVLLTQARCWARILLMKFTALYLFVCPWHCKVIYWTGKKSRRIFGLREITNDTHTTTLQVPFFVRVSRFRWEGRERIQLGDTLQQHFQ